MSSPKPHRCRSPDACSNLGARPRPAGDALAGVPTWTDDFEEMSRLRLRRRSVAATAAVGVLALACLAVADAAAPSRVVPRTEARRIAAEWGGSKAFAPTWAPREVSFHDWGWTSDAGSGNDRLILHFKYRQRMLRWVVSDSREIVRIAASIRCPRYDRSVFHRIRRGELTVWLCLRIGFPITVSVSQVGRGLGLHELERMVASARPLPPGRVGAHRFELPPEREIAKMARAFGRPLPLPRRLPGGFIYSSWRFDPYSYDYGGRRALWVSFGRDGRVLYWAVYAGRDRSYNACDGPAREINGRRIWFNVGIHGASARTCLPPGTIGNAKRLEIEVWYAIQLDNPTMRRFAQRVVADPRLVP